ncbi:MAG: hypothetical protein LBT25_10120 [Candidatus Symbiothrix sp.]|jgi:outer membrane protein assembly factor BamB|nr:hypothetical protein [Candidatus Symbiothrix sp.]
MSVLLFLACKGKEENKVLSVDIDEIPVGKPLAYDLVSIDIDTACVLNFDDFFSKIEIIPLLHRNDYYHLLSVDEENGYYVFGNENNAEIRCYDENGQLKSFFNGEEFFSSYNGNGKYYNRNFMPVSKDLFVLFSTSEKEMEPTISFYAKSKNDIIKKVTIPSIANHLTKDYLPLFSFDSTFFVHTGLSNEL